MASPMREASPSDAGPATASESRVRYDRGIRIWGAAGQDALEASSICLLHAGPTGSEALKNLVLGGIKSFTVVDGQRVGPSDLGNNFLLDEASLGQPRAAAVTGFLRELNETVAGSYVVDEPARLICEDPAFFAGFDIVIAAQLHDWEAAALDAVCRAKLVPLLLVRAYGLLGSLTVSVSEHCVVESKPDTVVEDLRLGAPWPALARAAAEAGARLADERLRAHVPYALLLARAAADWAAAHPGRGLPATSAEKAEFKRQLAELQPTFDGVPLEEENVTEAIRNAHRVWSSSAAPTPELEQLFEQEECRHLRPDSAPFWFCVAALKRFVEREGAGNLPLEGAIPDMHADSAQYLALQRLYREKAETDAGIVEGHVRALLEETSATVEVDPPYIRAVCKNARRLGVVRCPRVIAGRLPGHPQPSSSEDAAAEASQKMMVVGGEERPSPLQQALSGEDEPTAVTAALCVALHAADRFFRGHGRYPGAQAGTSGDRCGDGEGYVRVGCKLVVGAGTEPLAEEAVAKDVVALEGIAQSLLKEAGLPAACRRPLEDAVPEVVRWGGSELHCVAAIAGAIASQEAIKLLTGQFVPIEGTLFYNAVHCTSLTLGS